MLFPNTNVKTERCKVCESQDGHSIPVTVQAQNETEDPNMDGNNTSTSMDDEDRCAVSPCPAQASNVEPIVFGNTRPTSPTTGSQYSEDGQQYSLALSNILPTADNLKIHD